MFSTHTQFMGMRKVNTKGIELANKVMLMSGVAYNLKKYLKFINKKAQAKANALLATIYASIIVVLALNK